MKQVRLGNTDLRVSQVCLGTMTFGEQNTETQAHEQLDLAVSYGVNFIDTAEMYPVPARAQTVGLTERYVGSWLKRQRRDAIVLASKATGPGRGMDWIRDGELSFSRENLRRALEGSLQRLNTNYLDLYQLHWPDRNTPTFGAYHFQPDQERPATALRDTMLTLADFIAQGKIRYWGLSNETPWGLMKALRHADELGLPRPISVQNAFNLLNRTWETGLSEIGFRENVSLLAYSPLAFGLLSGKYLDNPAAIGRVTLFEGFAGRYSKPNSAVAVAAYADLARQHGLSPAQLALAFCYGHWSVSSTIIGATSPVQLRENLDATGVELATDVRDEIERIHLRFTNPAP